MEQINHKQVVDFLRPDHDRFPEETAEMLQLLQDNDIEVNLIPIRDLYQSEIYVGMEEFWGVQGIRRFLETRHESTQE